MDFWQFGIYIVILSGASSLVIMTIVLMVRKMSQHTPPQSRAKSKTTANEWAHAPSSKGTAASATPPTPSLTEQSKVTHEETIQPEPAQESARLDITEELSLSSPLSTPGTIEPALLGGASVLEPSGTIETVLTEASSVAPEQADDQTNEEYDAANNENDDPLSIFHMEDTQENPISELSVSLPDIDASSLLKEGKEILRILGVEAEEY